MPPNLNNKNLQNYSFKNQNLTGANFSNSDIRGADFSNAILTHANFSNTKAGLPPKRTIYFLSLTILLAAILGFISGFTPVFTGYLLFPYSISPDNIFAPIIVLTIFAIFAIATIYKGLLQAFTAVTLAGIICGTLLGILTRQIPGIPAGVISITVTSLIIYGMLLALAIATSIAMEIAGMPAAIITMTVVLVNCIAGGKTGVTVGIAVAEVFTGIGKLSSLKAEATTEAIAASIAGSLAVILFVAYMSRQIFIGDCKFLWIHHLVISIVSLGGTSFRSANLTDTNFTQSSLKNTDFTNATIIRTNFHLAKNLNKARVKNTILTNPKVINLAISKKGTNESYIGYNLKGINLASADLSYADFTEADISLATFERATLEGANLTKTQAIATNFQQAKLTATCLEAWNIDSTTLLENVICDYTYLLNRQRERRPSSGVFSRGEFTKLFQIAINTVDLIFRNGLDLQALSDALAKVKIENPNLTLTIKSIENKGDGVVIVRVDVPPDANKPQLHADFIYNYELARQALEEKYQAELKSKDEQISIYRQHQADLKELLQIVVTNINKTEQGKLVVLKLGQGDLTTGFPVTLQIGLEGDRPFLESSGRLPPSPDISTIYNKWQTAYRKSLNSNLRLNIPDTQITNISKRDLFQECEKYAEILRKQINLWLNSETFRPIKEQLLEKLTPSDSIRIILQTEDSQLRRIPFQLWDFFERYPKAEIALSSPSYEKVEKTLSKKSKVKILAILGDSRGINIEKDRTILEKLPNAEVTFLVEPQRQVLNDELWQQAWDILFFAGHSSTQGDREVGSFCLNPNDRFAIAELKNALKKAISQGLQLAIFNSCDGLGLAVNLADLHIPETIVMREPVPDKIAQEFLKNFLVEFSCGKPMYQSVKEARFKLQGLEDDFPCASWLPVIFQNPAEIPTIWVV